MTRERVRLYDEGSSVAERFRTGNRPRGEHGVIGPYSRLIDRGAIGGLSGRSREGRFLKHYEQMLLQHIGRPPSITQRALISRAARIALHLELLDERVFSQGKALNEHDYRYYASWSNSLARMLARLGLEPAITERDKAPTLADLFPGRAA
jgi:hypothetical protein